jgi:mannosyltransferase OCH1-like enzyme
MRTLAARLMQLFGNLLKPLFYLHLWLFPRARFTVPAQAAPLWKAQSTGPIPHTLWFTNFTDRVTLSVYVNYLWNRLLAPTCEVRLCLDEACASFVEQNFPGEISEAYAKLQIGAAKADFWRILMLLKNGGVYLDMDAAFCWPVHRLLASAGSAAEIVPRYKDGRVTNYFLASSPGNPLMQEIALQILSNIQRNEHKSVYDMTGPTVLEHIADRPSTHIQASRHIARQGQFTTKKLQYPDKLKGYWVNDQKEKSILK